jgi:hypothetical protein
MKASLPLLAFLAASLALPAAVKAQEGWLTFDSSEILPPGLGIAFSVRYPPHFHKEHSMLSPDSSLSLRRRLDLANTMIQAFAFYDFEYNEMHIFNVNFREVSDYHQQQTNEFGNDYYWNKVGEFMESEDPAYKYHGANAFKYKGFQAVNVYCAIQVPSYGEAKKSNDILFKNNLYITINDINICLLCSMTSPVAIVKSKGYTPQDNPATKKYCQPFFDSLELRL